MREANRCDGSRALVPCRGAPRAFAEAPRRRLARQPEARAVFERAVGWKRRAYAEQARLGQLQRTNFEGVATEMRWLLAELGGMAFLDFLGALTGRRDHEPG